MGIVKFVRKIMFLQAMRERLSKDIDLWEKMDYKVWDKMESLRNQFKNEYMDTKEKRHRFSRQYRLVCKLLKVNDCKASDEQQKLLKLVKFTSSEIDSLEI